MSRTPKLESLYVLPRIRIWLTKPERTFATQPATARYVDKAAIYEIYGEYALRGLQGDAVVKRYPQQQNGSKVTLEEKLSNQFSRDLLTGCLRVASDKGNPVRLHLAAAGLRELFGHILHVDAPDDEVRACSWFTQDPNTPTVTRRQKAIYSTQGGLTDDYVAELGLDVKDLHRDAIKSIELLNKATHVRPETIETDDQQISEFIEEALKALEGLIDSFAHGRTVVRETLEDDVYRAMSDALIEQTFDSIDILAGKGYEIDPWIDDAEVNIEQLLSQKIVVRFNGIAHATLHYGSKHDSAEIQHSFPFWLRFEAPVTDPSKLTLIGHHFDDRSWYT